jgi:hypothetical protein
MRGVERQFEERSWIDELLDAFTRSEPAICMLPLDSFGPAALTDFLLLIVDRRGQIGHGAHIRLEARRSRIDTRLKQVADGQSRGLGGVSTVGHGRFRKTHYYTQAGEVRANRRRRET